MNPRGLNRPGESGDSGCCLASAGEDGVVTAEAGRGSAWTERSANRVGTADHRESGGYSSRTSVTIQIPLARLRRMIRSTSRDSISAHKVKPPQTLDGS